MLASTESRPITRQQRKTRKPPAVRNDPTLPKLLIASTVSRQNRHEKAAKQEPGAQRAIGSFRAKNTDSRDPVPRNLGNATCEHHHAETLYGLQLTITYPPPNHGS